MNAHLILETFVFASFLGVILTIVSNKYKISAIILLLLGGIIAGPDVLNIIKPYVLGDGLKVIVSIAVGLILFEGGLTLNIKGYKNVSKEVIGILSWGVLITWIFTAIFIYYILNFDWKLSFLSSSLIIVTGPTVIGPLLQRIKVKKNLHHILHWEGVLIDPIGVFIALLCYEFVLTSFSHNLYLNFIYRFFVGIVLGIIFGYTTLKILKKDYVNEKFVNIFIVSMMILNFTVSDMLINESGLLSVVVSGLYLGYKKTPKLTSIIEYNDELKNYLIGLLFVLLAANLKLEKFVVYGIPLLIVVILVMFVVRPLNIFVSTIGSKLKINEKLFLSFLSPRGIVAASMASLFTFKLTEAGYEKADFLEAFTYSVIAVTIVFQGLSAKLVGKFLGVLNVKDEGWLIVGAHKIGRIIAEYLKSQNKNVVLIDNNSKNIKLSRQIGLNGILRDGKTLNPEHDVELIGVGNLLVITENEDLNYIICSQWKKYSSVVDMYFWSTQKYDKIENKPGVQIWKDLDLKYAISDKTDPKILSIKNKDEFENQITLNSTVLFTNNLGFSFMENCKELKFPMKCMVYENSKSDDNIPIKEDWIFIFDSNDIKSIYSAMLDKLRNEISLDKEKILDEILRREKEFTNLIGHGVSLPHLYTKDLKESIIMFAKIKNPIPCVHTKEDISMIFLVISPVDNQIEHLNQLAWIAKFLIKKENLSSLQKLENKKDIYKKFKDGEKNYE